MTPGEVKGLQQLAMAYGGSLTINPETGLPEAGFLKSLLPTLIGAGLMMIPGVNAVAAPWMIGLGVGGVEAARTGDIGKGLMAGLGAYGGAGLASSALAAGAATGQAGATISAEELAKSQAIGSAPMSVPPQFTPPETFMGNLSQAGSGVSNIFSSGATGQVARDAAMQGFQDTGVEYAGLGSPTAATMKTVGALAAPLSQPAPMPEVEEVEYNYDGPYKPTKREVTYPGADRDPTDSSEFLYFRDSNPYPGFESAPAASSVTDLTGEPQFAGIPVSLATDPDRMRDYQTNPDLYRFAEGGTSAVTAPPEGYVAGRDAEHVYGFQPMSTDMPVVQETARVSRGIDSLAPTEAAKISVQVSDGGDGYERDPSLGPNNYNFNNNEGANYGYEYSDTAPSREDEQQSRAAAAAAAAMGYAMGGKTMDHGGFVIDAHTVSEIGNGSSDAGHSMLARIGGEPIKGAGNGTSDSIRANIGGVQEARIAKDENYFSKEDVKRLGGGNYKKGEKKLYALMKKAHESRKKNGRGQASGLDNLIARMA
jgi:hypothetical protein